MKYLNALNKIQGLGPQKMKLLINFFGAWENAWQGSSSDFLESGLSEKMTQKIISERSSINPDQEWEKLEKYQIQMISEDNPLFPQNLLETPGCPFVLYQRGDLNLNEQKFIAVVGSRKHSYYGRQVAQKIAAELSEAGLVVVSGLALGIDAIAHEGALSAQGKTVAVLGSGLDDDNIFPKNNFNLAQRIINSGCLLSEYSPGTPANTFTFPARNRIIAGLSLGTLIIEAGEKSGSLITASLSLDYNREVFAIPGQIFSPQAVGTNKLIRQGAKLVMSAQDVLEEFEFSFSSSKTTSSKEHIPENETEKKLLKVLSLEPMHIDKIAQVTTLGTMTVSGALTLMEIKGWIKNIGGQNYILL